MSFQFASSDLMKNNEAQIYEELKQPVVAEKIRDLTDEEVASLPSAEKIEIATKRMKIKSDLLQTSMLMVTSPISHAESEQLRLMKMADETPELSEYLKRTVACVQKEKKIRPI